MRERVAAVCDAHVSLFRKSRCIIGTNDLIRTLFCSLLAMLSIGPIVHAAPVLRLVASSGVDAGSTAQLQLQTEGDAVATTRLLGWQASLMIEPQSGSTGSVFFSGASIPSEDYLLGVNGQGLSGVPTSPEIRITLFDADTSNPLEGGTIGVGEILRLADIQIEATIDATGEFDASIMDEGPTAPSTQAYRTLGRTEQSKTCSSRTLRETQIRFHLQLLR